MSHGIWTIGGGGAMALDRPRVMAILNVTPDSFSDGGALASPEAAAEVALRAQADGADLLDIGGESTRPGASRVSVGEQIRRVVPAIEAIRGAGVRLPMSVDTTHSAVVRAAADACSGDGAAIVNDVSAGEEDPEMLSMVGDLGLGIILMHRLCEPERDSYSDGYAVEPEYEDVVLDVRRYLAARVSLAQEAGVSEHSILVDPGLGFGKTVEQNLALVRGTGAFEGLGAGVVSGASRKSFVGRVSLGRDSEPGERISGSLALSVCHLGAGARVFRVHDVGVQASALRLAWRIGVGDCGGGGP